MNSSPAPDYCALFEAAPSPNLVLTPDFTIVAANHAYLRITQTVKEEIIGRKLFDIFLSHSVDPDAHGVERLRASLLRVLDGRCSDRMEIQKDDIRVRGAGGTVFQERYWSATNTPVFDAEGRIAHIVMHMEDVTEFMQTKARAEKMEFKLSDQELEIQIANRRLREANEELDCRVALRTKELRREREYFRSLLMAVPFPISVLIGPDHRYLLENEAHRRLTGYRTITGKLFSEVFPDMVEHVQPILNRIYRTGEPYQIERHKLHYDRLGYGISEEVYLTLSWYPLFGLDGRVEGVIAATLDMTAYVRAEAQARESEQRYRDLFDSIDEGFCIVEMLFDDDGHPVDYRFSAANPGFAKQSGLHNVVGKTMRELVPEHEAYWFEIYGRIAKTGEPARLEREAKALNRWFDIYAFRIDPPSGHKVGILLKDITEHKRSQEELRRSEREAQQSARQAESERRRLNAVLEAAPVGIVVTDANGKLLLANAVNRDLWGDHPMPQSTADYGEWKGWWADGSARHGQPIKDRDWAIWRVLRGETAHHDIVEIESFDTPPRRRILFLSAAPILDTEGEIAGAVVAQMDITDRIKAEEALRQADRRKDEFLAMLAHELRNPLAPITAAAEVLRLAQLNDERIKQSSAIIARQAAHMTGLVNDLLDVCRITRGAVALEKTKLDVQAIVADAVEQARPLIDGRKHRLDVRTPPGSAPVLGDPKRLVQIVGNLLNNAAKYTPEGGLIEVNITVHRREVEISVADDGIGMAPELAAQVFELFTQGQRASDRSQGGLGIGLALAKNLAELHGGALSAFSEGPGKGSRFTLRLPRLRTLGDAPTLESDPSAYLPIGESLNVLVVDDNVDAADTLAMVLETQGHRVLVEHRAAAALETASREQPQVCLLDIGLPDMDGNLLARRLREQPATAAAVLVAVTGYGQEQDRQAGLDAGFDHYFVKPVDNALLMQLMRDIAARRF